MFTSGKTTARYFKLWNTHWCTCAATIQRLVTWCTLYCRSTAVYSTKPTSCLCIKPWTWRWEWTGVNEPTARNYLISSDLTLLTFKRELKWYLFQLALTQLQHLLIQEALPDAAMAAPVFAAPNTNDYTELNSKRTWEKDHALCHAVSVNSVYSTQC